MNKVNLILISIFILSSPSLVMSFEIRGGKKEADIERYLAGEIEYGIEKPELKKVLDSELERDVVMGLTFHLEEGKEVSNNSGEVCHVSKIYAASLGIFHPISMFFFPIEVFGNFGFDKESKLCLIKIEKLSPL